MEITTTSDEQQLFDLLVEIANAHNVTLYAVGGWTRDKLRGCESNDIDILVDGTTGPQFADWIATHLHLKPAATIRANPAKSRHVETSRIMIPINGQDVKVDLAMGRSEVYAADSRTPVSVEPASPQDDARRRDCTVNSLFFNLHTKQVHDFTGEGLDDLRNGIIRAPGVPHTRFLEDPIRTLRSIRFACRFQFQIDNLTLSATQEPDVLKALFTIVARERIGEELFESMKQAVKPSEVFRLWEYIGIFKVFDDALANTPYADLAPFRMNQNNRHHKLDLFNHTMQVVDNVGADPVMRLAAFFHDWGKRYKPCWGTNAVGDTNYHTHEDHSALISGHILRYLRLDALVNRIEPIAKNHMRVHNLHDASDKSLRRLLRDSASVNMDWRLLIDHARADVIGKTDANGEKPTECPFCGGDIRWAENLTGTVQVWQCVVCGWSCEIKREDADIARIAILKERLEKIEAEPVVVPRNQCILDGHEIKALLQRDKDGPWIKEVKDWLFDLQDELPGLTKDEAKSRLLAAITSSGDLRTTQIKLAVTRA